MPLLAVVATAGPLTGAIIVWLISIMGAESRSSMARFTSRHMVVVDCTSVPASWDFETHGGMSVKLQMFHIIIYLCCATRLPCWLVAVCRTVMLLSVFWFCFQLAGWLVDAEFYSGPRLF